MFFLWGGEAGEESTSLGKVRKVGKPRLRWFREKRGVSPLVNPADRDPLRLALQLLQSLLQLLECPLHVVVDQAEVEVMPVAPVDAATLVDGPLQVGVLV